MGTPARTAFYRFGILGALALGISAFAACTTAPTILEGQSIADIGHGDAGILFPVRLVNTSGNGGSNGCMVTLRSTELAQAYDFNLTSQKDLYFIALPPGAYRLRGVYCGIKARFEASEEGNPAFRVEGGKLALLGGWELRLDDTSLTRRLEIGEPLAAHLDALKDLDAENRKRVASGYTGAPVSGALLKQPFQSFKLNFRKGLKAAYAEHEKEAAERMLECWKNELNDNLLALGHGNIVFAYEKGAFTKADRSADAHTYTDGFFACLQQQAATLKLGAASGEIELKY